MWPQIYSKVYMQPSGYMLNESMREFIVSAFMHLHLSF